MYEHPNVMLLREGYAAFAKGDLDYIREHSFAASVVFHVPGHNPLSGVYSGIDEVFSFFGRLFETTGGTFTAEPFDILASNFHGVALVHTRGEREGRVLEQRGAHVYRIADGRVVECWNYFDDLDATDTFFS